MTSEAVDMLLHMTLAGSGATLLLLCLRGAIRRMFGAQLAYLGWLTVPAAMVASILPAMPADAPMLSAAMPMQQLKAYTVAANEATASGSGELLLAMWALGAVLLFAVFLRDHGRFMAGLGCLMEQNGVMFAASNHCGPAVLGLWRPRIVVPAHFSTHYTGEEQRLILAHEQAHIARGDPFANFLCAILQCIFWFNPLMHAGARRFRLDQELACDAAVMRSHPSLSRTYADAMLKTQMGAHTSLITCHWQTKYPLKERIMQLKSALPGKNARIAGRLTILALIAACGYGSLSAQARPDFASGPLYLVDIQLDVDGEASARQYKVRIDEPFVLDDGSRARMSR